MAWTLAVNSATVNPFGAGARASTALSAFRIRGLFRSTPPTRAWPSVDPVAVQGGGESFGDAGQFGHDVGELVDHPAAAQLGGVVRLEPKHTFALSVLRTPVKVGIRCCLSCLASFRHTCLGAVDRSRGRGGAPTAQRGRTTARPTRIRRKLGRPGARQRRCGSSHLLPPVREERAAGDNVARAGAQPDPKIGW